MTIYDFIDLINDTENMVFRMFDCRTEDVVWVNTDEGLKSNLDRDELIMSEFVCYEICSLDTWISNGTIYFEFNIETDEEEDDDEWE